MIIVEYVSDSYKHSDANAAIITICMKKYENEKIHLFCGEGYFNVLKNILDNNNIHYENIVHHNICPFAKNVRDYKMILFDFNIVRKIFNFAKNNKETNILFLYTTTFMLYYTKLFCALNKQINIKSLIHGELERVDLIEYTNSFNKGKFWQYLYALFFGLRIPLALPIPENLSFIVMGTNIRDNLLSFFPSLNKHLISLPNPYFYKNIEKHIPFQNNIINLCVSGSSSPRKNIPILRKLISFIDSDSIYQNKVKLSFGGVILDKEFYKNMQTKNYVQKNTLSEAMLAAEIRDNALIQADYALITYPLNSYKLVSNGSFMDAVNMETPIIAIKNNYAEYYFKKYGNIGYILDSYEELEDKLKSILLNFPYDEYHEQVNNIKRIKETESIENIAKLIKNEECINVYYKVFAFIPNILYVFPSLCNFLYFNIIHVIFFFI